MRFTEIIRTQMREHAIASFICRSSLEAATSQNEITELIFDKLCATATEKNKILYRVQSATLRRVRNKKNCALCPSLQYFRMQFRSR